MPANFPTRLQASESPHHGDNTGQLAGIARTQHTLHNCDIPPVPTGNGFFHVGSDPAGLLKAARAAEVVECLRNCRTVEGCADLLYATRLAGAPLAPGAAAA